MTALPPIIGQQAAPPQGGKQAVPPAGSGPAKPADTAAVAQARETAQAFEAVLIGQLTGVMMETLGDGGEFSGGHGEAMFRGVLAEKLGIEAARRGGLGLAPGVMHEIIVLQNGEIMIEDLIDIIESLTLIMTEETARLESKGRAGETHGMVEAKLRLVAALEVRAAQVSRQGEQWLAAQDTGLRQALTDALAALCAAAQPNQRILARQIDLSTEMMGVVAAEAKRQTGALSATYGSGGTMTRTDMPAPISINASL